MIGCRVQLVIVGPAMSSAPVMPRLFRMSLVYASEGFQTTGVGSECVATRSASILLAGQLPFKEWHAYIDNPMVADAILDRMVNTSHRLQLAGESMRQLAIGDLSGLMTSGACGAQLVSQAAR